MSINFLKSQKDKFTCYFEMEEKISLNKLDSFFGEYDTKHAVFSCVFFWDRSKVCLGVFSQLFGSHPLISLHT